MFKNKKELDEFFKDHKLSELFHENSKKLYWAELKDFTNDIDYKEYPRFKRIILPKKFSKSFLLEEAIEKENHRGILPERNSHFKTYQEFYFIRPE